VAECLLSLQAQNEKDIEIIVVNDASDDDTADVLDYFSKEDKRIKIITNRKKQGAGMSRNIGNEHAMASIIAVTDDDDIYLPERATLIYEYFRNWGKGMINMGACQIDYFNTVNEEYHPQPFDVEAYKKDKRITYFSHPTAAYLKKDIMKIKYQPETKNMTDDYQLVRDWIASGRRIDLNPQVVCLHRVLPKSIMSDMHGFKR